MPPSFLRGKIGPAGRPDSVMKARLVGEPISAWMVSFFYSHYTVQSEFTSGWEVVEAKKKRLLPVSVLLREIETVVITGDLKREGVPVGKMTDSEDIIISSLPVRLCRDTRSSQWDCDEWCAVIHSCHNSVNSTAERARKRRERKKGRERQPTLTRIRTCQSG